MDITEISGYRIIRPLGAGGMGQVFLVEHPRLPRRDALKLLDAGVSRNDDFKTRFQREADLLSQLSHPNIVTLYDRGEFEGRLWITMEFIDGTDASKLVERHGSLSLGLVLSLISGAASALDYSWRKQGITHRDVKPANILVALEQTDEGPRIESVKLADFGIAKAAGETTSLTSTGVTVGTMGYVSPEALRGSEIDNRADVYSLGCTAFHLLTGRPPFTSTTITALMSAHLAQQPPSITDVAPQLPVGLNAVFERVLAKDPAARYPSCGAFVADLSAAADGLPISPAYAATMSAPSPVTAGDDPRRRRWDRWLAAAAIAVVCAAVGVGAYFVKDALTGGETTDQVAASTTISSPTPTSTTTVTKWSTPSRTTSTTTTTTEEETPEVVVTQAPVEGQPCSNFNEHSEDGTLYCSAMNGAWTDLTHQSRSAVQRGSSCSEPGARARVAGTDGIATCQTGPNGNYVWDF